MDLDQILGWGLPLVFAILGAAIANWLITRGLKTEPRNRLYRQLGQVAITLTAIIAVILFLPFDSATRGQLLSLFGLALTVVIALSSTTFVSNAMAGVTLKAIRSFHTGDFIQVADYFGRVRTKPCYTQKSRAKTAIPLPCPTCSS